jgi:hypothetical protein
MAQNMRIYQRYIDSLSQLTLISLSQVVVFVARNLIRRRDKKGWPLLRALRSFSIVDLFLSFEEHTQLTITAGRQELKKFGQLMQVRHIFCTF